MPLFWKPRHRLQPHPLQAGNDAMAEILERMRAPNVNGTFLLDQFWDLKRLKVRDRLPLWLLEYAYGVESGQEIFDERCAIKRTLELAVGIELTRLQNDEFLRIDDQRKVVTLTPQGIEFVVKRHPTVLMYWERILKLSPPSVTITASVIGFVASVFGIVQFYFWLLGKG